MELTITADDKNLETVLDFIHKLLPPDCETDLMYKIDVAAEEIFVNIASGHTSEDQRSKGHLLSAR